MIPSQDSDQATRTPGALPPRVPPSGTPFHGASGGRIPRFITVLLVALVAVTMGWRFITLDQRVFHGDEAVQAMRTAELMERGVHPFDPTDHHGPLLHYLSAAQHRVAGIPDARGMTEFSVRLLPFLASLLLFPLLLLLRPVMGDWSLAAMGLVVLSPCFFFYSGYFIQEPLLTFLSVLVVVLTVRQLGHVAHKHEAPLLALALGLLFTLKASALLLVASLLLGILLSGHRQLPTPRRAAYFLACLLLPILVVHSAFFLRPLGVVEFLGSLGDGFTRATTAPKHHHPPGFFLQRLLWYRASPGPAWSEWPIVLLWACALVALLLRWRSTAPWQRFLLLQPPLLAALYVLIPYKTPWLILSPLALLAVSASLLPMLLDGKARWIALGTLVLLPLSQIPTLRHTAGMFSADPRNPWVYAHTVSNLPETADKIAEMLVILERHDGLLVVLGDDYWPYPWHLRHHARIGYWTTLPDFPAPMVIAPLDQAAEVRALLGGDYVEEYIPMRPEVPLLLLTRRDLWREWLEEFRP